MVTPGVEVIATQVHYYVHKKFTHQLFSARFSEKLHSRNLNALRRPGLELPALNLIGSFGAGLAYVPV
jgi:hypothetical protein